MRSWCCCDGRENLCRWRLKWKLFEHHRDVWIYFFTRFIIHLHYRLSLAVTIHEQMPGILVLQWTMLDISLDLFLMEVTYLQLVAKEMGKILDIISAINSFEISVPSSTAWNYSLVVINGQWPLQCRQSPDQLWQLLCRKGYQKGVYFFVETLYLFIRL